jgi:hypothetical protein
MLVNVAAFYRSGKKKSKQSSRGAMRTAFKGILEEESTGIMSGDILFVYF